MCPDCGGPCDPRAKRCRGCANKQRIGKRPSAEARQKMSEAAVARWEREFEKTLDAEGWVML